jgi:hypothetical protein
MAQLGAIKPGRYKPDLSSTIDWTHPLSQGLELCLPFNTLYSNCFIESVSESKYLLGNTVGGAAPTVTYGPTSTAVNSGLPNDPSINFVTGITSNALIVDTNDTTTTLSNISSEKIFTMRVKFCLNALPSNQNSTWRCFFSKGNAFETVGTVNTSLFMGISNSGVRATFGAQNNGNSTYNINSSQITAATLGITANKWIDLVVVWRQSNAIHDWYVNGNFITLQTGITAVTQPVTNVNPIVVGGYPVYNPSTSTSALNTTAPTYAMLGRISNIMLWSRRLTANEIKQLYQFPYAMFNN